jgi:predicted permease
MGLLKRITAIFRPGQSERELDEELQLHIGLKTQEYIEEGVSAEEARYAAVRAFGGIEQKKEECRDADRLRWIEDLIQDLRYGLRQLRRKPSFTAVAVITLSLGIGANTAIFSVVDAVLLRPLPYKNASRLTFVTQRQPKDRVGLAFDTYREFEVWKRYSHSFEKLATATWAWAWEVGTVWSWRGEKREILAVPATVNFFSMLGVHAAQGRAFGAVDLKSPCTVVLAHAFWKNRLGGTAGWIGKSLILNNTACTIVGVMPKDFSFYPKQTKLWTLITPDSAFTKHPWDMNVGVFGLLKPGISRASAQAELTSVQNRIINENPSYAAMKLQPDVLDLRWMFTWLTGRNLRSSLIMLFGAVFFVLLIACVNVANLLLGRASERRKELGVRAALGSGSLRLIRQLLTESVVLSLGGAFLGTLVAVFCVRYVNATQATQLPPGNPVSVNWQVLAFTAAVAVIAGILFGLVPAWKASRLDLNEVLKESPQTASRGAFSHRASRILVATEMALSLIVLVAAGLLIESLVHLTNVPLGYERSHLLTADIRLPASSYPKASEWKRVWDHLGLQLQSVPGVKGAAFGPSLATSLGGTKVTIEGIGSPSRVGSARVPQPVTDAYFRVLGIPLLRGRAFTVQDRKESMPVAIVNEAFARKFFSKGDPLGQHIKLGEAGSAKPWLTVVGVVGNVSRPTLFMRYTRGPDVYLPLRQKPQAALSLFVRTGGDTRTVESGIGRAVTAIDSNLPRPTATTINESLAWYTAQPRFRAELFGIFGALALLLASVGIYGVLSQLVTQRTHEVGIRVALGAQQHNILTLIVGEGFKLTVIGIAIGIGSGLAVTRFLSSFLYGVSASDPFTFIAVSLVLSCVALLACYIPARRAMKVDPMVALRHE